MNPCEGGEALALRVPREAVDAQCLEVFQGSLNEALSNLMEGVSSDGRELEWDGL